MKWLVETALIINMFQIFLDKDYSSDSIAMFVVAVVYLSHIVAGVVRKWRAI